MRAIDHSSSLTSFLTVSAHCSFSQKKRAVSVRNVSDRLEKADLPSAFLRRWVSLSYDCACSHFADFTDSDGIAGTFFR